jgi:hypothetical protein
MTRFVVAVYEVDRCFGGAEEGGWWYDAGSLVRVMRVFRSEDKAYDYSSQLNRKLNSRVFGPNEGRRELSSVLSDGEYQARVFENTAPESFPDRRPHYD